MSRPPFTSRTPCPPARLPGVSRRRPMTLSSCPGLPSPLALPVRLPACPASAAAAPRPCLHVPASLHLSHSLSACPPARRQPPPPHDPVFMSRPPFTSRTPCPPARLPGVSRRRPMTLSSCPGLPSPVAPARPGLSAWRSAAAAPRPCLHVPASLHLSHSLSACPPARRQPPPPHDPVFMSRPPFARRSCSSRPVRLAVSRRRPTTLSSCPGLPSPLALPVRLPPCPPSPPAAPRPCLHVPASLRPSLLLVPACPPGGQPPPPHDPVFMSRPPFTSRTPCPPARL